MDKKSLFLLAISGALTFSGLNAANSYSATIAELQTKPSSSANSTTTSSITTANDKANAELIQKIQSAIKGSYSNFNINVRIVDGKVFLTGTVASEADKSAIEADVKRMDGVKSVVNDLKGRENSVSSPRN